jgi:hypothetical protein
MTLSEIKDQVAQESEYPTWDDLLSAIDGDSEILEKIFDVVTHKYARQYAEEDRKDCAEKAEASINYHPSDPDCDTAVVNKASILNRPYPELT